MPAPSTPSIDLFMSRLKDFVILPNVIICNGFFNVYANFHDAEDHPVFIYNAGYCAEYNQVTNKIQMDEDRPCIHNTAQKYFYYSDKFFCKISCDLNNNHIFERIFECM